MLFDTTDKSPGDIALKAFCNCNLALRIFCPTYTTDGLQVKIASGGVVLPACLTSWWTAQTSR
jgi:hypothetical protein